MHVSSRCASWNKTSSRLIKTTSWSSDDHTLIVHVNGRVILVMCLFSNAVQLTVLKHIQFLTWPTFVSKSQWRCVDSKMTSALFWSLACHAICECSCDLDSKQPGMIWYVVVCHGRDELIIPCEHMLNFGAVTSESGLGFGSGLSELALYGRLWNCPGMACSWTQLGADATQVHKSESFINVT